MLAAAAAAEAGGPPGGGNPWDRGFDNGLFLDMPLNYDTSVVYPFGGEHRTTPGTVTITRPSDCPPPQNAVMRPACPDPPQPLGHIRVGD